MIDHIKYYFFSWKKALSFSAVSSQGKVWRDVRSKVNPHMMQPQTVTAHITQISEVTIEFIEKIRTLRDPKTLELPNNFMNELYKWSLECKYMYMHLCE